MFDRLGRREDETPFVVQWFVQQGIGLITTADYISGTVSKPIYRGRAYIEFISVLYFAQTLLNCPTAFTWQANSRETPWFRKKTYKKNG